MKQKLTLLALLLGLAYQAAAQHTDKLQHALAYYPELQAAWVLPQGNYAYFSVGGRRETDAYPDRKTALGLDFLNLTAGYEHTWNPAWSWGGTLRYATEPAYSPSRRAVVPGLLLRHRAALGGVQLGQRLGVEYALGGPAANVSPFPTALVYSRTLLRLRLDAEKLLTLGDNPDGWALRPRLSFEPALFLRLQQAESEADKRTIDFTSLRAELGVRPVPEVEITPWVALQTNYIRTIIQYDSQNQPTSNGKLNTLTPVVGVAFRYTLQTSSAPSEWQQLSTQN